MTRITMKQGLWCHLQHEGHNIAVHCSLWSGKEVVYVDDHPVSEHRNLFRFTGRHALRLNNQDYTLEVEVENPFTYRTEVRLKKVHVLTRTHISKKISTPNCTKIAAPARERARTHTKGLENYF